MADNDSVFRGAVVTVSRLVLEHGILVTAEDGTQMFILELEEKKGPPPERQTWIGPRAIRVLDVTKLNLEHLVKLDEDKPWS